MAGAAAPARPRAAEMLAQLEFYFGDANLRRDGFLRDAIESGDRGYVGAELVASFNKMAALNATPDEVFLFFLCAPHRPAARAHKARVPLSPGGC